MKNIRQYFDYLFTLERTGMKYDLINIKAILKHIGNPQNDFQSIHIAGTNGKGSTASFIASILMEHGLKVGLFTSPHILRFNERIRVNGKCISNKYIKEFLDRNNRIIRKIKPSFFEVNTTMAFEYFSTKKVDIAVVECGLGGRLDSTNVLYPSLSVITQIGMDHMQYLGNTLKKIAMEKIGIVKPGVEVIVSDNNKSLKKLFKKSIGKNFLCYLNDEITLKTKTNGLTGSTFVFNNRNKYHIPLSGQFQVRNAATAILASEKFLLANGISSSNIKIQKGLKNVVKNTGYRARLEVLKYNGKEIILDVSHNPDGLRQTVDTLKSFKPDIVIFGIMEDKNIPAAINEIIKLSEKFIFTKAKYKRAADPKNLHKIASKIAPKNYYIIKDNVKGAVREALAGDGKRILITGSFFITGEVIKALRIQKLFR